MGVRTRPIQVLLTDSRPVVLKGLDDLINANKPVMEVAGQATDYATAIYLAEQLRPDVVVFSFFPDALDPLEVVAALVRVAKMKVLLLKGMHEAAPVARAIGMGARGIVLAEDPTESIVEAIIKVNAVDGPPDKAWLGGLSRLAPRRYAPRPQDNPERLKLARLTMRERELIRTIVANPPAKYIVIGAKLGISEHTVHNHLSSIYHKLDLINRTDLLVYAVKHQIAGDEDSVPSGWVGLD